MILAARATSRARARRWWSLRRCTRSPTAPPALALTFPDVASVPFIGCVAFAALALPPIVSLPAGGAADSNALRTAAEPRAVGIELSANAATSAARTSSSQ